MIVRCDSAIFADTVNFNITTNVTSPRSSSSTVGLTASTSASAMPASPAATTVTSIPTQTPAQTNLTGGAIAGIVMGCLVSFAVIGGLFLWVLKARRGGSKPTSKLVDLHEKPEREGIWGELANKEIVELGTGRDVATELPQSEIIQELDASAYPHK